MCTGTVDECPLEGSGACICKDLLTKLGRTESVVVDDQRLQQVVAVATVCTASQRYDGDLLL